ncbi:MAG: hypothetical protein KME26_11525 [Oscillatoria princeps RMCB-10]|nr:hypothetical protein [Oscillatoria princeps RMCB-10]
MTDMTIRVAFFKSLSAALDLWIFPRPVLKVESGTLWRTPPPGGLGTPPAGTFGLTQPLPHSHWHRRQPVGTA